MRLMIDITQKTDMTTPVFPGDPPFEVRWHERIDRGGLANVSQLRFSPHVGTHIDAPKHIDGKTADVSQLPLEPFVGRCRVLDFSEHPGSRITPDDLPAAVHTRRLLIKTRRAIPERFTCDYIGVSAEAVEVLRQQGVCLIGTDTPGLDPADSHLLPSHHAALDNGVFLLENLDLTHVSAGEYELIALPLKLGGAEASPVRAVLRQ